MTKLPNTWFVNELYQCTSTHATYSNCAVYADGHGNYTTNYHFGVNESKIIVSYNYIDELGIYLIFLIC